MAKPTVANSRWDTDGTNMTAPSGGQRDTGIVASAAAVSSYINYLFNQVYLWFVFLDGLFSAAGAYTAPVNEHVTVSGTGRFKHGDDELWIHSTAWEQSQEVDPFVRDDTGTVNETGSDGVWTAPLLLPVGRRVKSIDVYVTTSSTAGTRSATLHSLTSAAVAATIGTGTSTTISSTVTISIASLPHTLLAKFYSIELQLQDQDTILGAKVVFDYP
jgi:hypothetical protein